MLKDRVVVVTGGAGLIGRQFIREISQNGAIAIIADINLEAAKKVKEELTAELVKDFDSIKIDVIKLDITSLDSLNKAIDSLQDKYGRIDALVNNAYPRNKEYGKHFFDVSYDSFCENVNLHLGGYFLASQQFAKFFKKQGSGNIVSVASIYGVMAPKFEFYDGTEMTVPVEYAVIKSALLHLTKYMAKYLKNSGVRVNCLSPGGIFDNQNKTFLDKYNALTLSKGMLDPKDISGTLVYLLSDMSKFVNGQNIIIDDGVSL